MSLLSLQRSVDLHFARAALRSAAIVFACLLMAGVILLIIAAVRFVPLKTVPEAEMMFAGFEPE